MLKKPQYCIRKVYTDQFGAQLGEMSFHGKRRNCFRP